MLTHKGERKYRKKIKHMTIAQQRGVTKFPFIIKDDAGNEIYFETGKGSWYKAKWDNEGVRIYYENSSGYIVDNRQKPAQQALISQLEEIVCRLEEDGLYALQGIKDAIAELKK